MITLKLRELIEIARKAFGIPGGHFCQRLGRFWKDAGGGEFGINSGVKKADIRSGDVANQFHGALGDGIRAVVSFIGRDGFENFLGRAVFILECAEQEILQPEFGEFGSQRSRHWASSDEESIAFWAGRLKALLRIGNSTM